MLKFKCCKCGMFYWRYNAPRRSNKEKDWDKCPTCGPKTSANEGRRDREHGGCVRYHCFTCQQDYWVNWKPEYELTGKELEDFKRAREEYWASRPKEAEKKAKPKPDHVQTRLF